jgi:hypothetical protein
MRLMDFVKEIEKYFEILKKNSILNMKTSKSINYLTSIW